MNGPRVMVTPRLSLPEAIPAGMSPVEFFNSPANLKNLASENGLFRTPEDFLMYRKLLGHSLEFDTSIILDKSQTVLDPLGRPVRRDQLSEPERKVWNEMTRIIFHYMKERYPDPAKHVILFGEASLDPTWPLSRPGVPSIRMAHNHFIVFRKDQLAKAPLADPDDPNLTDSGHHGLFLKYLGAPYLGFFECLDMQYLRPISTEDSCLFLTGYPQGLPSWEVAGGGERLTDKYFWDEYDLVLKGFLDFYRSFFTLVATGKAAVPQEAHFPEAIEKKLLGSDVFLRVARELRDRVRSEPHFANDIRWRPAYKQMLYRDDAGRLIVTISQNSVGNAITELLGIVIKREEDSAGYLAAERALVEQLLEVRRRLTAAGLGKPLSAPYWPEDRFVPRRAGGNPEREKGVR